MNHFLPRFCRKYPVFICVFFPPGSVVPTHTRTLRNINTRKAKQALKTLRQQRTVWQCIGHTLLWKSVSENFGRGESRLVFNSQASYFMASCDRPMTVQSQSLYKHNNDSGWQGCNLKHWHSLWRPLMPLERRFVNQIIEYIIACQVKDASWHAEWNKPLLFVTIGNLPKEKEVSTLNIYM